MCQNEFLLLDITWREEDHRFYSGNLVLGRASPAWGFKI